MDSVGREQAFLDRAYERLDEVRADLAARAAAIVDAPGTGTAQDVLERQALLDHLDQQAAAAQAGEQRLCFGHLEFQDGGEAHLGRIGLRDHDGDPLLLDWRAPQAAGFYQATALDPMGLRMRRRIFTRGRVVTHVEDDDLDDPFAHGGRSAAAASMATPRDGRMADIAATIAADQDVIIRSPLNRVTVVQGGPGTGKTVVALHRAAWLLYTYRDRLARDGVLVVGPSNAFCRYIEQVLPSLGETDVVLLTPGQLFPTVSTTLVDDRAVRAIKGDPVMADVVARAVRARVRLPDGDLRITLEDGSTASVCAERLRAALVAVPRHVRFHAGREPFLRRIIDDLARDRARRRGEDPEDPETRAEHRSDLVEDSNVRRTLNRIWLPTTPERVVSLLLSDPATLAAAANGLLDRDQQARLLRSPDAPWTVDDVPLLDEAADLLGPFTRPTPRTTAPEEGYAELSVDQVRPSRSTRVPLAERAASDRDWVYGHVVVDEAQELSHMAWRALARRCGRRSMTVVGDLQQVAHPAGARSWPAALGWAGEHVDLHTLTVTYRITRQTAKTATDLLVRAGGRSADLLPIRDGAPTEHIRCAPGALASTVLARRDGRGGRTGVIVPDERYRSVLALLAHEPAIGFGDDALDAEVSVLTVAQAKGLEFDHVIVIDPQRLSVQAPRGADAYVACTRATQTLHLIDLLDEEGAPAPVAELLLPGSER